MRFRSIRSVKDLKNKTVLVRSDFNVPVKNGKILDEFKITRGLPTLRYLAKNKAKVIVMSHLGRPKDGYDKNLTLAPVRNFLERKLNKRIELIDVDDWVKAKAKIAIMSPGDVALLENIRFIKGEEKNDKRVSRRLADLGDIYVLDGFAAAHRESSSVSGLARYLPAYAGLLMADEMEYLGSLLGRPKYPFVVVLGGAKMETKIPVLKNLLRKADRILLGGGIVNTCLWARGYKIGNSLITKSMKRAARKYCSKKKVVVPIDVIVGDARGHKARAVEIGKGFAVKSGQAIYDIGPETIKLYAKYIKAAETIVWNGAVGYFEQHPYEYGTFSIARLIGARSKGRALGICGGGETIEVLRKLNLMGDIDFISTGGGAMLEFLGGEKLPGVEAVKSKKFLKIFN